MTLSVLDSIGTTQTINTLPPLGQATKTASLPVAFASDSDPIVATSGVVTSDVTPTGLVLTGRVTGSGVGGVLSFLNMPTSGLVEQAQVSLASGSYTGTIDLLLFKAALTTSTTGDNSAVAITAADLPNLIGVVHLADVTSLGAPVTLLEAQGVGQPFVLAAGTTIYGVAVLRGTLTLAGATDAIFKLRVVK